MTEVNRLKIPPRPQPQAQQQQQSSNKHRHKAKKEGADRRKYFQIRKDSTDSTRGALKSFVKKENPQKVTPTSEKKIKVQNDDMDLLNLVENGFALDETYTPYVR